MHGLRLVFVGAAFAASVIGAEEWKEAGVTTQGNRVYVSDVKGGGEMRSAWIRIVYKEPLKTADGLVKSSRAKIRVN